MPFEVTAAQCTEAAGVELPDEVVEAALAAWQEVRYGDHPDNERAIYGVSAYALRVMLAVAYQAGRESAFDHDEWRVCSGPANRELPEEFQFPYVFADAIESEQRALDELGLARNYWRTEQSWIEHRRVGAAEWVRVPEAVTD
jgi:hypothetical protein